MIGHWLTQPPLLSRRHSVSREPPLQKQKKQAAAALASTLRHANIHALSHASFSNTPLVAVAAVAAHASVVKASVAVRLPSVAARRVEADQRRVRAIPRRTGYEREQQRAHAHASLLSRADGVERR